MTRFSKLAIDPVSGKLVESNVREIPQSAMLRCPHFIMLAEHYREDSTCRCNDPEHVEMREWGYTWRGGAWR